MDAEDTRPIEEMAAFFDLRAAGYDAHICGSVFTEAEFMQFYRALARPIQETHAPIQILDLGCGTGLELEFLLQRAPHARMTGVDLAPKMLDALRQRYAAHMDQITLVVDSYLTLPLGQERYDYVLSAMTMHHLLHESKRRLYAKIRAALKPGGRYIEGDSVTTPAMEGRFLADYHEEVSAMPPAEDGYYHVDVPLSLDTQRSLLMEAGFSDFQLIWHKDDDEVWQSAVYVVKR